jgi:hypothetical protein
MDRCKYPREVIYYYELKAESIGAQVLNVG